MAGNLYDKVTENWEAWSNREYVIFQHLNSLYESQKALSKIIAFTATTAINPEKPTVKEYQLWEEFFEPFGETLQRARVKVLKSKSKELKEKIDAANDEIAMGKKVSIKKYADLLFIIGCLYDQLGYSSPERKVIKSPFVSDLDTGMQDDVSMEAMD